jgi:hypothetical protein
LELAHVFCPEDESSRYLRNAVAFPPCYMVSYPSEGGNLNINCRENLKQVASRATLLHAGFLIGLLFDPENGGDMFL